MAEMEKALRRFFEYVNRPCWVDGKPAIFHRWVEEEQGVLIINSFVRRDDPVVEQALSDLHEKHLVRSGCSLEKLKTTRALVEYPDGTVGTVPLELIKFDAEAGS